MESDRLTMHAMAVQALEGEGDFLLSLDSHVGEDDE